MEYRLQVSQIDMDYFRRVYRNIEIEPQRIHCLTRWLYR